MKIKLDENLPPALADLLEKLGHAVDTTVTEGLKGGSDREVWDAAQKEARFFVTQDLAFSILKRFVPGTHAGILLLRLREPSRRNLITTIQKIFQNETVSEWVGCFVVATEVKTRVLTPKREP